jgi:hypothetical protein
MSDLKATFRIVQLEDEITTLHTGYNQLLQVLRFTSCRICDNHIDGEPFDVIECDGEYEVVHVKCIEENSNA